MQAVKYFVPVDLFRVRSHLLDLLQSHEDADDGQSPLYESWMY